MELWSIYSPLALLDVSAMAALLSFRAPIYVIRYCCLMDNARIARTHSANQNYTESLIWNKCSVQSCKMILLRVQVPCHLSNKKMLYLYRKTQRPVTKDARHLTCYPLLCIHKRHSVISHPYRCGALSGELQLPPPKRCWHDFTNHASWSNWSIHNFSSVRRHTQLRWQICHHTRNGTPVHE